MTVAPRLAIIVSHPIQYFSPWFRWLARETDAQLRVFFLDNPQQRNATDPDFGRSVQWDIPLLEGFESTFVENTATDPGTHHYWGLRNPTLWSEVQAFAPTITLLMTYRYHSILPAMLRGALPSNTSLRGDSVLLSRGAGVRQWLADRIVRRAFAGLAGALFVGQHNRRYFVHHGMGHEQLKYSPPAIDLMDQSLTKVTAADCEQWRKSLNIPLHHCVVLFVGKIQSIKRPLLLLKAFQLAAIDNTSLVFVGTGEQAQTLATAAHNDPRVHLLGFQNQRALPTIYRSADLLVLPSVSETWGLVVNEAFSMGTGALVSDAVGCAPDLVEGRDTGLVFASDNCEALADGLCSSLVAPDRLTQWGNRARALVTSEFDFAAMSRGLREIMDPTENEANHQASRLNS